MIISSGVTTALIVGFATGFDIIDRTQGETLMTLALVGAIPAAIWSFIAMSVKRLHDQDHSAWCLLIGIVPIVGGLIMIVVLGFMRGTEGANRYDIADTNAHGEEPAW